MIKRNKMFLRIALLTLTSMLIAIPVFAATDPGVKANTWLQTNVGALVPGVLLIVGVYFLITRDWMKLVSFVGIALVVAMLLNWEEVKKLAKGLWDAIFGA
jgi:uncharacterized membrane protein YjjP (DUF1212 family)